MKAIIVFTDNAIRKVPMNGVNPDFSGFGEPLKSQLQAAYNQGHYTSFGGYRIEVDHIAAGAVDERVIGNNAIQIKGVISWQANGTLIYKKGVCNAIAKTGAGAYAVSTSTIPLTAIAIPTGEYGSNGLSDTFASAKVVNSSLVSVRTTLAGLAGGARIDAAGSLIIIF